jgi:hypothetical protein
LAGLCLEPLPKNKLTKFDWQLYIAGLLTPVFDADRSFPTSYIAV